MAEKQNYEYAPGSHTDVVKHIVFVALVKELREHYPDGIVLVDAFCGSGIYDLASQDPPEYLEGVAKIVENASKDDDENNVPQPVMDYVGIVSKGNDDELVWYPGSPLLGFNVLGSNDEHRLCDLHLDAVEVLQNQAAFEKLDAFDTASLDYICPEDTENNKHKVILIDPDFTDSMDFAKSKDLCERILDKDRYATIILWIPLFHGSRFRYTFPTACKELGSKKAKIGRYFCSLTVQNVDLQGGAIAVFNPTPGFDDVVDDVCMDWLSKVLKLGPRSDFVVEQFMKKKKK